jgi:hypothetical protein
MTYVDEYNQNEKLLDPSVLEKRFRSLEHFEDFIVEVLGGAIGASEALHAFLTAQSRGVLNEFYDLPERWTMRNALDLVDLILGERQRTKSLMDKMCLVLFGVDPNDELDEK